MNDYRNGEIYRIERDWSQQTSVGKFEIVFLLDTRARQRPCAICVYKDNVVIYEKQHISVAQADTIYGAMVTASMTMLRHCFI